ncbi:MAG: BrnA antitoxin family protein [Proteobacteria bacterium]|nr:hypothetical protein [Pseudomonadota bacterium]NOG59267.1 BrnA antitoxin family protein [Pseudomonadota bacterium]
MSKRTKIQKAEIKKLAAMPDEAIDTSDIPETTDWSNAVVGKYYKPVKKQVTLRLDADMLDWFKSQGGKYQTRINKVLRRYMESQH